MRRGAVAVARDGEGGRLIIHGKVEQEGFVGENVPRQRSAVEQAQIQRRRESPVERDERIAEPAFPVEAVKRRDAERERGRFRKILFASRGEDAAETFLESRAVFRGERSREHADEREARVRIDEFLIRRRVERVRVLERRAASAGKTVVRAAIVEIRQRDPRFFRMDETPRKTRAVSR